MSPFGHGCDPLCDPCVAEQLAQLRGVARSRGHEWCGALLAVIPVARPWPATTPRMLAIARRRISDLTRDARLRELLAHEVIVGAARRWDRVWRVANDQGA